MSIETSQRAASRALHCAHQWLLLSIAVKSAKNNVQPGHTVLRQHRMTCCVYTEVAARLGFKTELLVGPDLGSKPAWTSCCVAACGAGPDGSAAQVLLHL